MVWKVFDGDSKIFEKMRGVIFFPPLSFFEVMRDLQKNVISVVSYDIAKGLRLDTIFKNMTCKK